MKALPDTTGGDTISSGNWIIDNLNSSLETWNGKLSEIWTLLTTSPENFKGGGIWNVIVGINDALKAIAYALLVLFFVIGVMKTCGSFTELKRPEVAFKCFIRFVLAQAAVTYGMELMTALFSIAQGAIQTIMGASGLSAMEASTLPAEIASTIEDVGLLESIPLWAVTLLGSLFIWVLSLVMILTVYGRFFKLYMATAIAPIPLSSFEGQPSSSIGMAFIKSYAAKHGGDGKRIDAAISAEDGEVVFRIRDYGPGIPEEELPHVKMKFYKGSSKARGSGIGLAVCEEIVTMHGGTLTLENAEGGGTLVTVRLPMGEESR